MTKKYGIVHVFVTRKQDTLLSLHRVRWAEERGKGKFQIIPFFPKERNEGKRQEKLPPHGHTNFSPQK